MKILMYICSLYSKFSPMRTLSCPVEIVFGAYQLDYSFWQTRTLVPS